MPLLRRQYLALPFGILLLLWMGTWGSRHTRWLMYLAMEKVSDQVGVGMNPYSFLDLPPLNDTFASPTRKRIAVVMAIHSNDPLYQASILSHQRYCQMHGYRFMTQSQYMLPEEPFPHPRGHEYQKMAVLMHTLLIGLDSGDFDWILYVARIFFLRFSFD